MDARGGKLLTMKLGEMLVRDGRLTEAQLEQALARQAKVGGRIGTVLVEMGFIDADALTVYLGLELGIPIATTATLDRAKRAAVRLLSPDQAARFRCVPIIVQDRQLIAAIDDPLDWEALDELSRITGYRIVPRVAPEIRIYFYLELFYGVPRPPRFQELGKPERGVKARADLPAPPLPGLPPRARAPIPAPTPPTPLRAVWTDSSPSAPAPEDHEALELDAADLVEELDADEDAVARRAASEPPPPPPKPSAPPTPAPKNQPPRPEPLTRDSALQAMAEADARELVADALVGYALGRFDSALLLMVRDNMAFGWKAVGPGIDGDRVDAILIPLEAPSMFQVAIYNQGVFRGRPFPATLHNYVYKVLRIEPPPYAVVAASFIGARPVNLLYGHVDSGEPLTDDAIEELGEITRAASEAYVRLIAASKKRSG